MKAGNMMETIDDQLKQVCEHKAAGTSKADGCEAKQ